MRPARDEDIAALVDVHIESWRGAYRGLIADEVLERLDTSRERRVRIWRGILSDARQAAFVAEDEGAVLGFANVGPARPPVDASVGELYAIYLRPAAWRRGVGRALITRAEEALRAFGFANAILWVLAANDRARRFYEAVGWVTDGDTKVERIDGVTLDEVRYSRRLRD